MISQIRYLQVIVPSNIVDEKSAESSVAIRKHQNIILICKGDGFPIRKYRREDGKGISIKKKGEEVND